MPSRLRSYLPFHISIICVPCVYSLGEASLQRRTTHLTAFDERAGIGSTLFRFPMYHSLSTVLLIISK